MTTRQYPLGDLAQIRTGFQARGQMVRDRNGNARLVHARDVSSNVSMAGLLDYAKLQRVLVDPGAAVEHWLAPGHILFFGRVGQRHATLIRSDVPSDVLADKVFFVISLNQPDILPAYLTWHLNSGPAQRHFAATDSGSVHSIITKQALAALPVPVPRVAVQETVAEAWQLLLIKQRAALEALDTEGEYIRARLELAAWRGGDARLF